jgi:hypothetical protein
MTDKDKKLLELFTKYIINRGCSFARFEVDAYIRVPYYSDKFSCVDRSEIIGTPTVSIVNMDEVIKNILEENNSELFDEDDEGNTVTEIYVDIYPETRTIKVSGNISVFTVLEESTETSTQELPEDISNRLKDAGIKRAYIDFSGGGDSGYIEDSFRDQDNNTHSLPNFGNLETVLLRFLDNYGDWYNNEGANGNFTIDVEEKEMSYQVTPNGYLDEEFEFFELKY